MVKVVVEPQLSVEKLIEIAKDFSVQKLDTLFYISEKYGDIYTKRFLFNKNYTHENLLKDKLLAFEFFIDHSFRKGRKNELSERYISVVLKELYKVEQSKNFIDLTKIEGKIPPKDKKHLESLLKFIKTKIPDQNIYRYIFTKLISGDIRETFKELRSIHGIGDKIARFIIRDIMLVCNIDININNNIEYLFPIDTHVNNFFKSFGIDIRFDKNSDFNKKLSKRGSISVAKIAAGIWYLHYYSFDILKTIILEGQDLSGIFKLNI